VERQAYIYTAHSAWWHTIAPWMQFYLQLRLWRRASRKDYAASRLDVIVGVLYRPGGVVYRGGLRGHALRAWDGRDPGGLDAADACVRWRRLRLPAFAFGLFNASVFAASILPLSTALTRCEGMGFESVGGQELQRGAVLLLALYAAHRWRGRDGARCCPTRN